MDELKEISECLLRFSPDALIVVDEQGLIRFANETVTQLFGHLPTALVGKNIEVLVPERLRFQHGRHLSGFMGEPRSREMGAQIADLFALRADGSEFSAGIRLAPFRMAGRLFIAAAIRDTTERRQANEALKAAREEADRANRAKSRFLATASHDLRQPMQTIKLLNSAMLKVVPQPDIRELLQQQGLAIESMTKLLNALLDISRLESGAIQPLCADVSLAAVFDELRSEFESLAATRGIDLKIGAPVQVISTDRTLFYQLLQNLLGNALKYTDSGTVSLRCLVEPDALRLVVEDTGIGIPADKLARIFDEYYQVDTHGAKRMGVGLGLAIVKEVSRLLGFDVRIESTPGKGTKASICIANRFIVTCGVGGICPAPQSSSDVPCQSRLILVEDNEGVRLATELFLKLEGYAVLSAASFAEAQSLFDNMLPHDIVIADYHLEEQHTGLGMLLELRQRLADDVPGIILSGDLPTVLRSLKAPVANCRFLAKPVDTAALISAINELCAASSGNHNGGSAKQPCAQAI